MVFKKTENFIITLVSISCIGLIIESYLMDWEFWVPPLILVGTAGLWVMNLTENPTFKVRKILYLAFSMLTVFYHGVHLDSFFDGSLVIVLMMVSFSFLDRIYVINSILVEYVILLMIQFWLTSTSDYIVFDKLNVIRTVIHIAIVCFVYLCCVKVINDRLDIKESEKQKEEQIEINNSDMDDFLSNISHELRTPVNVVNGMSDLLIKRNVGKEVFSIKDAGIRLAHQIEDIQDYTECKREKLLLEEDEYMSTSLINDVVVSFRMSENNANIELVVDLDPTVPTKMRGDVKKLHKIFRHLLGNAVKFTKKGGIYVRMYAEKTDYGVNLCIEMTDTGIGMDRKTLECASDGLYQENKKRNRSSGGIGLGLYIVYGFTHSMGGFVKLESDKSTGTTVRITVPQKVADDTPCLVLSNEFIGNIVFHVRPDKYKVPRVRDFYRTMASNLATGIHVPLYSAETTKDIERLNEKIRVTHVFMGQEEYEDNPEYFDELSKGDIVVAVSAFSGFKPSAGSHVMVMPKPLYGYPAVKLLNEGKNAKNIEFSDNTVKPSFEGIHALIVDDEPMNLVVATSLFSEYEMVIDTAGSGKEALRKYRNGQYDIVFMDHMMPEMDGVETMKRIKKDAEELNRNITVVALTANVVSGAREMFIDEGFDGFIAKPINIADFERVMLQLFPNAGIEEGGKRS